MSQLDLTPVSAALLIATWYKDARCNEDHPFTVRNAELSTLARTIQAEFDRQYEAIQVLRAMNLDLVAACEEHRARRG